MEEQGGACAICHTKSNALCVDHCHNTGVVRGLMCREHNLMLGYAEDSISILISAANYLRKSQNGDSSDN